MSELCSQHMPLIDYPSVGGRSFIMVPTMFYPPMVLVGPVDKRDRATTPDRQPLSTRSAGAVHSSLPTGGLRPPRHCSEFRLERRLLALSWGGTGSFRSQLFMKGKSRVLRLRIEDPTQTVDVCSVHCLDGSQVAGAGVSTHEPLRQLCIEGQGV